MADADCTRYDLAHLAVIVARGADVRDFLAAQLTSDVRRVSPRVSQIAGWCTAQGRVIATLRVVQTDTDWLLVLARDLLEPVLRRLRMYVLRAKVELVDAGGTHAVCGLVGDPAGIRLQELPASLDDVRPVAECSVIGVAGPGPRWLAVGTREALAELARRATGATPPGNVERWRAQDIAAGLPHVGAAASERYVPQMLNLQCLGAVSFDKGCYPGQEIVARLKFKGGLKRRLFVGSSTVAQPPAAGTALVAAGEDGAAGEPAGEVLDAARAADGTVALLAVAVIEHAGAPLHLGDRSGPLVRLREPPYPVT